MLRDFRYALRLLARDRAFTLAAIVSLALGIGATTAVFSVVDRILFRSLPYAASDRLISIGLAAPMLPYDFMFGAGYLDFRTHQNAFESVTSWTGVKDCDLTTGEPVRLSCAAVESTFLSILGIAPVLGRSFTAEEDRPNQPASVLISYGLWQSRFAARADAVGQTISLDGQAARVVGVLPRDFETPTLAHADLVIPQALDDAALQRAVSGRPLRVIARLRSETTLAQAQTAADVVLKRVFALAGAPKNLEREVKPHARTLRDLRVGDAKSIAWVLFGCVLAVLLLACANVANLLLARLVTRRHELSVRAALGASRARLIQQAVAESLCLSMLGGVCGIGLAYALLRLLVLAAPQGIPQLGQASLDARVAIFTVMCSVMSGLIFGLGPALATPHRETLSSNRSTASAGGGLRRGLIVAQLAFSLALLTSAGLLIRALWAFEQIPLGMDTQHVLTASLSLSAQRYPAAANKLGFAEELERRLRNTAAFSDVSISDSHPPNVPLRSKPLSAQQIDGRAQSAPAQGTVMWRAVTPEYFRTLGIPIRRGRSFTEQDRDPTRGVLIVSESLARRLFRNSDPVGHFLGTAEIVGVAADVRNSGGTSGDEPEYYVPRSHAADAQIYAASDELRRVVAIVRTPLSAEAAARALREQVAQLDAALPVEIERLQDSGARLSARPRFNAMLMGWFASVGLVLAAFGIYGVLGFLVASRTREIGIRMALGATPESVVRMILGSAARWLAAGLLTGLALSIAVSQALRSLLFGISTYDPLAWTAAAAVLVTTALVAAWYPSRRASRIDPLEALREE